MLKLYFPSYQSETPRDGTRRRTYASLSSELETTTAHVFARIARKLELPTTAPLADLRQIVEGRLAEGGHEPTNVEVLVAQSELGSTITLRDEGGAFLEVPPEEEGSRPDERGARRGIGVGNRKITRS